MPRPRSDGLRLTKVGLWFVVFAGVAVVAAINTGNNGLYLVVALMGGVFVVSQLLAAWNVRGLAVELEPPPEVFANHPAKLGLRIRNRSRWLPRWLLVATIEGDDVDAAPSGKRRSTSSLFSRLGPRSVGQGGLELLIPRRGRREVRRVRVASLFPFGFFRKGLRHPVALELLVFPELFAAAGPLPAPTARLGDELARRAGWGHDLFALRPFRHGDDPRGVHWKQSARTGSIVFKERRAEESRRLSIVFDNAAEPATDADRARFERLVSEAATAAVVYLERGYEVELLTRDLHLPFAAGRRQRHGVLEALALVEPVATGAHELLGSPTPGAPELRLALEGRGVAA